MDRLISNDRSLKSLMQIQSNFRQRVTHFQEILAIYITVSKQRDEERERERYRIRLLS